LILGHLLNPNGFIESEMTVTRLSANHYYLLSAAVAQLHDFDQLAWRRLPEEDITITDVTDAFGTLVLAGPKSRDALAAVTEIDLSNAGFRWLTGRIAMVAGVPGVRLLRVNYVGELGWELHAPMADMPKLFEALMTAGRPHGMRLFGAYAMNSLRMEKAYRGWGSELTTEIDMFEASMARFIRLDKLDFIGRDASLRLKQRGPRMRLVYLEVDATDSDCMGNEPVYAGEKVVGVTTSGAFGHAVGKSLAFAYVPPDKIEPGTEFEIMLFQQRRKARIVAEPMWDPENMRIRG
jgi:dimethylglycine dehydrogenase